jgi:hypothetical protein
VAGLEPATPGFGFGHAHLTSLLAIPRHLTNLEKQGTTASRRYVLSRLVTGSWVAKMVAMNKPRSRLLFSKPVDFGIEV